MTYNLKQFDGSNGISWWSDVAIKKIGSILTHLLKITIIIVPSNFFFWFCYFIHAKKFMIGHEYISYFDICY